MTESLSDRLYIATMCENWQDIASEYGLGIETDHFCQAENIDGEMGINAKAEAMRLAKQYSFKIIHAPFNELFPAAIDSRARMLTMDRLNQAADIALEFGIKKMVVHSGYIPFVYFKEWHRNRSVEFWKEFMADKPEDFEICIENVLDDEPYTLVEIAEAVADHRVGLCYDVGHANMVKDANLNEWLNVMSPYLKHLHIHNNDGTGDFHGDVMNGNIDIKRILDGVIEKCGPDTTITLEVLNCENTLDWFKAKGYYK